MKHLSISSMLKQISKIHESGSKFATNGTASTDSGTFEKSSLSEYSIKKELALLKNTDASLS